jgi:hypothetical protein
MHASAGVETTMETTNRRLSRISVAFFIYPPLGILTVSLDFQLPGDARRQRRKVM